MRGKKGVGEFFVLIKTGIPDGEFLLELPSGDPYTIFEIGEIISLSFCPCLVPGCTPRDSLESPGMILRAPRLSPFNSLLSLTFKGIVS